MSDNQDILGQINATEQGSAPQSVWAQAIGGPVTPQAQAVSAAGTQLLAAAKAGHFAVEPDYAKQLIAGIKSEVERLRGLARQVEQIQLPTQLGETPAAQQVAPFNMQVAVTGQYAFVPNHHLAIAALENMSQAIDIAMGNYRQTDDDSAGTYRRFS